MGEESGKIQGLLQRFTDEFIVHFHTGFYQKSEKCKRLLLRRLSGYVLLFTTCLLLQCTSETELFICDGQLLPASYSVISRLRESTKHLDFRANIRNIYYSTFVSIKKTSSVNVELKAYIYERYNDIVDDALYNFALYIQCVQTGIVKSFHASQNGTF